LAAGSGALRRGDWQVTAAVAAFSLLALILSTTLIRSAFRSNRTSFLVFGLLFGILFMAIRWASLVGNLLWSGLLLLVAGAGLLLIARSWIRRDRAPLPARAS